MARSDDELKVVSEDTFLFRGKNIKFAILENNHAVIARTSIHMLLDANANDLKDVPSIIYWNSKNKFNNGLYLKEIPELLISMINSSKSEKLIKNATRLLMELSYLALKSLTGEQEIVEDEPKKEPSFDQLLGALMKVPPKK